MLNQTTGFVEEMQEGNAIENLTSQFGLHQVIKEPTHILDTSSLSIDRIFMSHI